MNIPNVAPPPSRFNAARYCLASNAVERPDKTALTVVGPDGVIASLTYAQAQRAVLGIAGGFRELGLAPGGRVMIRLGNGVDYVLAYFGALAAGLVAIPSSPQLTVAEAAFLIQNADAALVVVGDHDGSDLGVPATCQVVEAREIARMKTGTPLADYADTAAEDAATLVYTSGTGGRPKGVLHAHRAVWGRRPMHAHWLGLRESDVMLHAGAMNWTYTLGVGITDPWACGASAIVYDGPRDPALWPRLIAAHRATIFAAVPSVYRQILKYADLGAADLASLRHGVTAGEALPAALHRAWTGATGTPLFEALGMSEISTYVSTAPDLPVRPGSPGKPQPGRCICVLPVAGGHEPVSDGTVGLLAVHESDPGLMLGYWRRPEAEAAVRRGPWFVGGDLARFDSDGYLWFEGRNDDLMNAMGYRVSPDEVERVIAGHPDVVDAGVRELAVRADVTVIAAFVVLQTGAALDAQAVSAWCAERLAPYKCPREIRFVAALPRTANGKLQRKRLGI